MFLKVKVFKISNYYILNKFNLYFKNIFYLGTTKSDLHSITV